MSNIYRHFRKKRPQDKFALDATKKKETLPKNYPKIQKNYSESKVWNIAFVSLWD